MAPSTYDAYSDAIRLHIFPGLGLLQLGEATVGVADRFLTTVKNTVGPSAAKHSKTVLSQVLGLAARREAVSHNPIRDDYRITVDHKAARSLTLEEVRQLRSGLRADLKAVERDVPALVDFMLGTGMRIGEVLAVTWPSLDLDVGTVEVKGTLVRIRGKGLAIWPRPKTAAGWRQLHLPEGLVSSLQDRERVANDWDVVFPSQRGKVWDRSNTNADAREAMDPLGFGWVTTHVFRKTAATLL